MNDKKTSFLIAVLVSLAFGVAVWASLRFTAPRMVSRQATISALDESTGDDFDSNRWREAIAKVKEDRGDLGNNAALNVPGELRRYDDPHWFLATQVAEVKKHNLESCQDFVELESMIQRGELVAVPAVADDYVLMGVGAKADDGPFAKYQNDQAIPLYDESQLRDEYARLEAARATTATAKAAQKVKDEASARHDSVKPRREVKNTSQKKESENEGAQKQQPPKSIGDQKALLDRYYNDPTVRQSLFADYDSLQLLAENFRGHSYDLRNANDRQALKTMMLSSLRPEALHALKEIAHGYRNQFNRPLPVSSLIRPEQYQHTLHRFNRNAVLIETPPHSTGLAFDIDYRYMSVTEQNFVMAELARLKDAGRIEVIRERNANYHVFVFLDGVRPSDDLITASLKDAGAAPTAEAENANRPAAKATPRPQRAQKKTEKSKHRTKR